MAELITIVCPHCNFSKTINKDLLPKNAVRALCAACKKPFPLKKDTAPPPPLEADDRPSTPGIPPPTIPEANERQPSPSIPAIPTRPTPAEGRNLRFKFAGTAGEYFGVWIVNTLLIIVTVGIYSAWAKVRKRRFLYGSTTLDGQAFEYLANPLVLFRGWLLAVFFFLLYMISSKFSPMLSIVIGGIVFLAFPWLLVRSRMFNATNSSHRNIRFRFQPAYREAYFVYFALPILSVFSLGILSPYMLYRQKKFMIEQSSYGRTPFTFKATGKDFYILGLKVLLAFFFVAIIHFILGIVIAGAVLWSSGGFGGLSSQTDFNSVKTVISTMMMVVSPLVYFIIMVYGQTALANLCWNGTELSGNQFASRLRTGRMVYLIITSVLAILLSFGLLMPWATVRMIRYRFETLSVESDGSIDRIVADAANQKSVNAIGEEIGDVFDLPVEIGI